MTENFIHFAKKKIAELLTNLLDLQNSSDRTQPHKKLLIIRSAYRSPRIIILCIIASGVLTVLIPAANKATALPENVGSSASLKSAAAFLDCRVKNTQLSLVYFYE